jgi:hypothetical protein
MAYKTALIFKEKGAFISGEHLLLKQEYRKNVYKKQT